MSKKRVVLSDNSNRSRNTNCKFFSNKGKLMFINSEKKAKWYIRKTGAKILEEKDGHIKAIQLTFEPKGQGYDEDDIFGLTEQKHRCVVTASTDNLTRHHIVPHSYRKYMPDEYKNRNHHDVVFMTDDEHDKYERLADIFKDDIHRFMGVPTIKEVNNINLKKTECQIYMNKILGYIKTIKNNNLPIDKKDYLTDLILNYYNRKFPSIKSDVFTIHVEERLIGYIKNTLKSFNSNKVNAQKQLVEKLNEHNLLDRFVIMWRQHFIENVKPKYMPEGWDINYRVKTKL